jgi:UTP-glucose-1-phosphate uridylyltransferase
MKATTLLIMAAGLGSRYGGNKQIDGLGPHGEILMQYSIYDAIRAGFRKLVFVIKPEHREVMERICGSIGDVQIVFAYQDYSSIPSFYRIPEERIKPFGTVHAVLCAADVIREPFAVINADDFYGADAFRAMQECLQTLEADEAAMVSYRLANTVSRNGAVTRGVCHVEEGYLKKVTETYQITVDASARIVDRDSGVLEGDLPVSMNLWGFTPAIFSPMREEFERFLRGIPEGDLKAEYALPTLVDGMIGQRGLRVRVLSTHAVWFGVTYREDRDGVAAELARLCENGTYPSPLFS